MGFKVKSIDYQYTDMGMLCINASYDGLGTPSYQKHFIDISRYDDCTINTVSGHGDSIMLIDTENRSEYEGTMRFEFFSNRIALGHFQKLMKLIKGKGIEKDENLSASEIFHQNLKKASERSEYRRKLAKGRRPKI